MFNYAAMSRCPCVIYLFANSMNARGLFSTSVMSFKNRRKSGASLVNLARVSLRQSNKERLYWAQWVLTKYTWAKRNVVCAASMVGLTTPRVRKLQESHQSRMYTTPTGHWLQYHTHLKKKKTKSRSDRPWGFGKEQIVELCVCSPRLRDAVLRVLNLLEPPSISHIRVTSNLASSDATRLMS